MGETIELLPGEGEEKVVKRVRVRRPCDYCGEPAFYQNTYLNEGKNGARNNPKSAAYRKDDCSWCSDYDDYVCPKCHQANEEDNVPEGFRWCSTFQVDRFPHLFLEWQEYPAEEGIFCTGHDLTSATEAGVTLDSVLGALRRFQKDFCSGYCRQLSNASDHFEKCNDARAILAHFPDGDESK